MPYKWPLQVIAYTSIMSMTFVGGIDRVQAQDSPDQPAPAAPASADDTQDQSASATAPESDSDKKNTDNKNTQTTTLDTVDVTGKATPDYHTSQTSTVTGTDTPAIDIPQSVQSVPDKLMQDQSAQSLQDVMRNVPGVSSALGEGSRDEFYMRGVKTKSDFFIDGMRDDTKYQRDPYNLERVDVVKGPSAILFGRGGAGGSINLVTKKPERRSIRHMSYETGSWHHNRGTFDFGDSIGDNGAFRIMGMGQSSDGFREHDSRDRYAINPKFHFDLDDKTQLDFGFSYYHDRHQVDRGIPSRDGRPAKVRRKHYFGAPDQDETRARVMAGDFRLQHEINDHLTVRNAFRVTENKNQHRNVYPGSAVDDHGRLDMSAHIHPNNRLSYLDRLELEAEFDTGPLEHKLLTGAEFNWQRDRDKERLEPGGGRDLPGKVSVNHSTVKPVDYDYLDRDNKVVGKSWGVYTEDQISLGEHWKAMAGVRWDRFSVNATYHENDHAGERGNGGTDSRVDNKFSPRGGLIYKPVENDSMYVSFSQSYTPTGSNLSSSYKKPTDKADLKPEKATNYEIGNKLNLFNDRLSITAALFQLELDNTPINAADGSGRTVANGKQRSRGAELSINGEILPDWDVYANYTWLDAEYRSANRGEFDKGARVGKVPHHQFSVWSRYKINSHWGVGAGIRGASGRYTSHSNDVKMPGYVMGDAMAYYQNDQYRVQINVNNITDKKYYETAGGDNQIMPGTPRSVTANLSMDF